MIQFAHFIRAKSQKRETGVRTFIPAAGPFSLVEELSRFLRENR
jgi:hypothetical protein